MDAIFTVIPTIANPNNALITYRPNFDLTWDASFNTDTSFFFESNNAYSYNANLNYIHDLSIENPNALYILNNDGDFYTFYNGQIIPD